MKKLVILTLIGISELMLFLGGCTPSRPVADVVEKDLAPNIKIESAAFAGGSGTPYISTRPMKDDEKADVREIILYNRSGDILVRFIIREHKDK